MSCMRLQSLLEKQCRRLKWSISLSTLPDACAYTNAAIRGDRSAHAHVPTISLHDCYFSTPRMREMRAHMCLMRACSCPCSSCNVSPPSKLAKPNCVPTLHSFNVVLAWPRSVHLASSQGAGAPLNSAHNKYKNPK